jgi:TatD DNase family protein
LDNFGVVLQHTSFETMPETDLPPLFDTHAHLAEQSLSDDSDELIRLAEAAGLVGIVAVGIDSVSSRISLELAQRHPTVFASAGIHPNHCQRVEPSDWQQIIELARHPRVVAIGETGIDKYWDDCPVETQTTWFANHIQLSFETGKPLIVHQRKSEQEILEAFAQHHVDGKIHGIMHSFTGTWETAQRCLNYGMYLSFAGMITFKNAADLREIAQRIPDDRILIETDSPYLTPHPFRGKQPNKPSMVTYTAQCLAEIRGSTLRQFAEQTSENARRVFQLH